MLDLLAITTRADDPWTDIVNRLLYLYDYGPSYWRNKVI